MKLLLLALTLLALSPADTLVETGRQLQVRSIVTGQPHPVLQAEAETQAAYQARIHRQGHFWWDQIRYPRIRPQIPECSTFSEVVNESLPGTEPRGSRQGDVPIVEALGWTNN